MLTRYSFASLPSVVKEIPVKAVRIWVSERTNYAFPLPELWTDDRGQDIAEYAVMLAVILVLVVGTIRLVGSNANNVFSSAGSAIQ